MGLSYDEFFKSLTGFAPHPYQGRIQALLCAGKSVILRVPTGAGKTWAATAPFLHSLATGSRFADRLLYALPLRSLASSLHSGVFEAMVNHFGEVMARANGREYGAVPYCSLQSGGQKDDPFLQSDLVFTTIDQVLSGYVFLPVSLPDRVGNINAGALIGSLLVFDEIHLLDPSVALGTVIEMLDRLRGLCQFVLMTATTSDVAISWLADRLIATPITVSDDEIRDLPSQRGKQRTWRWSKELVTAADVAEQHAGERTIVLLNSVRRAQDLFLDLERRYAGVPQRPDLLLLHSRFYPDDRKSIEAQLTGYFGPGATQTNVILVTTQVIEAGMDISADDLHTELAPMNALIQRAGRVARYEDRPVGRVAVYEAAGLGPYKEDKRLVDDTRAVLRILPPSGRVVDFVEERVWTEAVHAPAEEKALREYDNLYTRRLLVHKAMDEGDRGMLSALVRDIDSIAVAITASPEKLFEGRGWPRLLSVPGFSLSTGLAPCFRHLGSAGWVVKGAHETQTDERPGTTIEWQLLSEKQLRSQWLVAIHPEFSSYDFRVGLRLGSGGPEVPILRNEAPPGQHYSYLFEPWVEHCQRAVRVARAMRPWHVRGAALLAAKYSVKEIQIEELVEIASALHDTGKLSATWQSCAWLWQEDKDQRDHAAGRTVPERARLPIAHTSFDAGLDEPYRRQPNYKFPPHAVQGAFALADSLAVRFVSQSGESWGQLAARCVLTAIARHHGPRTRNCEIFRLPRGCDQTVMQVVAGGWGDLRLQECTDPLSRDQFSEVLLTFGESGESAWPLYVFLVRRLRLADQGATASSSLPSL